MKMENLQYIPMVGSHLCRSLEEGSGYYREIKYFTKAIMDDTPIQVADAYSTKETIRIAKAEEESADRQGEFIEL